MLHPGLIFGHRLALLIANEQRNAYGLRYNDYERYRYVTICKRMAPRTQRSEENTVITGRIVFARHSR